LFLNGLGVTKTKGVEWSSEAILNEKIMIGTYLNALQIGIIAGMRSLTAPALVSHKLSQIKPEPLQDSPLHFLTSPKAATTLAIMAGGELIGDKLPNSPDRIAPPVLSGRIISGAMAGAALSEADRKPIAYGAVLGALGALVGTVAFYHLRTWLNHEKGIPDVAVALVEDAMTVGAGWVIVNGGTSNN
jgi:uncharacterized membrane protein